MEFEDAISLESCEFNGSRAKMQVDLFYLSLLLSVRIFGEHRVQASDEIG